MRGQSGRKEINWASSTDDWTFEPNIRPAQEARYINFKKIFKENRKINEKIRFIL